MWKPTKSRIFGFAGVVFLQQPAMEIFRKLVDGFFNIFPQFDSGIDICYTSVHILPYFENGFYVEGCDK